MLFKDETVSKTCKIIATALLFGAALLIVYRLRNILFWLVVGAFLAIIINPAVDYLTQHMPGKRRGFATAVVITAMVVFWVILALLFVPPLLKQATALVENWPNLVDTVTINFQHSDHTQYRLAREYGVLDFIRGHQGQISGALSAFFVKSVQNAGGALSSLGAVLTVLAMAVYMSVNGPTYMNALRQRVPRRYHEVAEDLGVKMYAAITGYVNGNLLTSGVAALTSGLMALAIGLPYPALLGIVVGLMDLIPMIGASLGAAIVVIVALFTSLKVTIIMVIFFLIYQQFENYVLQPKVMSRTVKMSSFSVFVSALCGAVLAGFLGALLAIPVGACIQILFHHFFPVKPQKTFSEEKPPSA